MDDQITLQWFLLVVVGSLSGTVLGIATIIGSVSLWDRLQARRRRNRYTWRVES